MDGFCEGGLGQQSHVAIFTKFLRHFRLPSHALVADHMKRGMPLHDVVGVKCEKVITNDIEVELSSICVKGQMLDDCV